MTRGAGKLRTLLWLTVFFGVLAWSAVNPKDGPTWLLEALPALVGLVVMVFTYRRFPLTPLLYFLILVHSVILMVGAHYTYAEVPAFDWLAAHFGWERNNYDKVGHFAQGFVPAVLAREILVRNRVVAGGGWLGFLVVSICLAFSALYELFEWWVALAAGGSAEQFLGTQGYQWDTQSDMALALVGAASALLLLSRVHDRQLARLAGPN